MKRSSVVFTSLLFLAAPAWAEDVTLPAGDLNGASGTCPAAAKEATLRIKDGADIATLKPGDRKAHPAKKGEDFQMVCKEGGVTNTYGTGCFFDGYIVAGFESGHVRIACYEGEIPTDLK